MADNTIIVRLEEDVPPPRPEPPEAPEGLGGPPPAASFAGPPAPASMAPQLPPPPQQQAPPGGGGIVPEVIGEVAGASLAHLLLRPPVLPPGMMMPPGGLPPGPLSPAFRPGMQPPGGPPNVPGAPGGAAPTGGADPRWQWLRQDMRRVRRALEELRDRSLRAGRAEDGPGGGGAFAGGLFGALAGRFGRRLAGLGLAAAGLQSAGGMDQLFSSFIRGEAREAALVRGGIARDVEIAHLRRRQEELRAGLNAVPVVGPLANALGVDEFAIAVSGIRRQEARLSGLSEQVTALGQQRARLAPFDPAVARAQAEARVQGLQLDIARARALGPSIARQTDTARQLERMEAIEALLREGAAARKLEEDARKRMEELQKSISEKMGKVDENTRRIAEEMLKDKPVRTALDDVIDRKVRVPGEDWLDRRERERLAEARDADLNVPLLGGF